MMMQGEVGDVISGIIDEWMVWSEDRNERRMGWDMRGDFDISNDMIWTEMYFWIE